MESIPTARLPDDFVPTDLHWLTPSSTRFAVAAAMSTTQIIPHGPNNNASATSSVVSGIRIGAVPATGSVPAPVGGISDALLITSTDGRFIILNRSARVERNVTAHAPAAITQGRWSPDGAGLLTAGEDGAIKVWSRSGMLRSTVVAHSGTGTDASIAAIRCACWSPASDAIAFAQATFVAVKPLSVNSKLTKWQAHDGLVMCIAWSPDRQLLASGGEDGRYKIWTSTGALIFASYPDDWAITAVAFSTTGGAAAAQLLAVGGFNGLRLCDSNGVCLDKPNAF